MNLVVLIFSNDLKFDRCSVYSVSGCDGTKQSKLVINISLKTSYNLILTFIQALSSNNVTTEAVKEPLTLFLSCQCRREIYFIPYFATAENQR